MRAIITGSGGLVGSIYVDYPCWYQAYDVRAVLEEVHDENRERWLA